MGNQFIAWDIYITVDNMSLAYFLVCSAQAIKFILNCLEMLYGLTTALSFQ